MFLRFAGAPATFASRAISHAILDGPLWRQAPGPALTWSSLVFKPAIGPVFSKMWGPGALGNLAAPTLQAQLDTWGAGSRAYGSFCLIPAQAGLAVPHTTTLGLINGVCLQPDRYIFFNAIVSPWEGLEQDVVRPSWSGNRVATRSFSWS